MLCNETDVQEPQRGLNEGDTGVWVASYQSGTNLHWQGESRFNVTPLPAHLDRTRMPKEQAWMGERAARSSSKNTKDKSNSAALLASRGRAAMEEEASERASRCSSEKDSGYSDTGSDSLQTDLDDQRSSVSEPQRGGGGGASSGGATPLPSTGELAPIYIIKNLVLKQKNLR
ncbi:hypothetical protein SKAU_G00089690 [Synaphobranchus kaupii]|uniref:Uncharacterized protein n=1 Tax=Synaphobranchus kaupii TaxID=118154 RepID=A0A9Q1J6B5_SYNKA|nr:hypothetical protein SKAU_G00089690 [Synaphobranchus kaupii]